MGRTCPRCAADLTARSAAGVEVDLCTSCGGVFLDESEFDAAIARRFEGKNLESLFAFLAADTPDPLSCPCCGVSMQRLDYEEIEIDRCPGCAGIWIDGDERDAFARRAQAASEPPPPEIIACDGCGQRVPKRLCIRRMDAYWCEACVVAGNHPGPEAQLVGVKEMHAQAAMAMAKGRVRQAEMREMVANNRARRERMQNRFRPWADDFAVIEIVSRWLSNLFAR